MSAFWFLCILFTFSIENYRLNFSFEYSDQPLTRKSISKHTLFQKRRLVRLYLLGAVSAAIYMFRPKWWNKNHMVAMHTHTHTQLSRKKERSFDIVARLFIFFLLFVSFYGLLHANTCMNAWHVSMRGSRETSFFGMQFTLKKISVMKKQNSWHKTRTQANI